MNDCGHSQRVVNHGSPSSLSTRFSAGLGAGLAGVAAADEEAAVEDEDEEEEEAVDETEEPDAGAGTGLGSAGLMGVEEFEGADAADEGTAAVPAAGGG